MNTHAAWVFMGGRHEGGHDEGGMGLGFLSSSY
jgi:hypothetical protein